MSDEVTVPAPQPTTEAPAATPVVPVPPVDAVPAQPGGQKEDLLKRATTAPEKKEDLPISKEPLLNSDDIAKIKDPESRALLESIEKNMEKGLNKKFMEIAELKKQLEAQTPQQTGWTSDRLQEALKDPNFINLVQSEAQRSQAAAPPANFEGNAEEWSAMSEAEQGRIKSMESQLQQLLSEQKRMVTEQERREIAQNDSLLKEKFQNYDATKIDAVQQQLLRNEIPHSTIREMIHKAITFEETYENSYELGLRDRDTSIQDKINGSTNVDGTRAHVGDFTPREAGTNSKAHFSNIANRVLSMAGK